MHIIFMNSGNSKTSNLQRLILNLSDKTDLKRNEEYVDLSNLSIYFPWQNIKNHTKAINSKYQLYRAVINFNYLTYVFCIRHSKLLEYTIKEQGTVTNNPQRRIWLNKIKKELEIKLNRELSRTFNTRNNELLWNR